MHRSVHKIECFYSNWKATRPSHTKLLKEKSEMKIKLREAKREAEHLCGNWGRRRIDPVSTQAHTDLNRLRELIQSAIAGVVPPAD